MLQAQSGRDFETRFHTLEETHAQPGLVAVHGTMPGQHKFSDWSTQVEMSGNSGRHVPAAIRLCASSNAFKAGGQVQRPPEHTSLLLLRDACCGSRLMTVHAHAGARAASSRARPRYQAPSGDRRERIPCRGTSNTVR